jgi:hypothetical protein
LGPGNEHIPVGQPFLRVAAPVAGSLITLSPLLFQQGEFNYAKLLDAISSGGAADGWDIAALQSAIDRLDKAYRVIIKPLSVIVATSIGYVMFRLRPIAPIESVRAHVGAIVVLIFVGHATATGVWGATKVLVLVRTASNTAKLTWHPFRSSPPEGIQYLFRFGWVTGLAFSASNLAVPALFVVWPLLPAPARVVEAAFIGLALAGGSLLFWLTNWWSLNLARDLHHRALDQHATIIEKLCFELYNFDHLTSDDILRVRNGLETALLLRQHILQSSPAPKAFMSLLRSIATLSLPAMPILAQHFLK